MIFLILWGSFLYCNLRVFWLLYAGWRGDVPFRIGFWVVVRGNIGAKRWGKGDLRFFGITSAFELELFSSDLRRTSIIKQNLPLGMLSWLRVILLLRKSWRYIPIKSYCLSLKRCIIRSAMITSFRFLQNKPEYNLFTFSLAKQLTRPSWSYILSTTIRLLPWLLFIYDYSSHPLC